MSDEHFSSLAIAPAQIANLNTLAFTRMTQVQQLCLPPILAGRDLIVQAQTGSGKTIAFGVGLLEHIDTSDFSVQALVLCPTRELATQIAEVLRKLARCSNNTKLVVLSGGKPLRQQVSTLKHGAHIVVGTPGRVQDHLQRNTLKLEHLKLLVIDEADRMLARGFLDTLQQIVSFAPKQRQTLLFSATIAEQITSVSGEIQHQPLFINVQEERLAGTIEQIFVRFSAPQRHRALIAVLQYYKPLSCIVFCQTKKQCAATAQLLVQQDIQALAIHGDLEQDQREQILIQFANNSCAVLVATDVAARGLDIKALPLVINYELPANTTTYVHRVGRTGRASASGRAVSLYHAEEEFRLERIFQALDQPHKLIEVSSLDTDPQLALSAPMRTLAINLGRKHKIRPGDILGALTRNQTIDAADIGKIDVLETKSYVAIKQACSKQVLQSMQANKIKGKTAKAWLL